MYKWGVYWDSQNLQADSSSEWEDLQINLCHIACFSRVRVESSARCRLRWQKGLTWTSIKFIQDLRIYWYTATLLAAQVNDLSRRGIWRKIPLYQAFWSLHNGLRTLSALWGYMHKQDFKSRQQSLDKPGCLKSAQCLRVWKEWRFAQDKNSPYKCKGQREKLQNDVAALHQLLALRVKHASYLMESKGAHNLTSWMTLSKCFTTTLWTHERVSANWQL